MHDGTVTQGDAWLHQHLDGYAQWAKTHDSLLIVTFDEDDYTTKVNLIPTFFVGAHVKTGKFGGRVDHTNVLATLEAIFGLPPLTTAAPITNVFASD
jgi:acid phosphatase